MKAEDTVAAITALIANAVKANDSGDALRFSQAACNVANATACIMATINANRPQLPDEDIAF